MKNLILSAATTALLLLGACGEISTDVENSDVKNQQTNSAESKSSKSAPAKSDRAQKKAVADLSKMDIPEIIDFVNDEATDMTKLLKTVTDGPSAEAAVEEIRVIVPRLNAAFKSLENMDTDNIKLTVGNMRRLAKVAKSQTGLFEEVGRISKIPEARAVLEREFDKIEITNL